MSAASAVGNELHYLAYYYGRFGNLDSQTMESNNGAMSVTESYSYDDLHRLTGSSLSSGGSISYNALNKPTQITAGGSTVNFAYDANWQRFKKTVSGNCTVYYIDDSVEVEQVDDTTITRTYIDDIAIVKRTKYAGLSLASHEITYTLRDRLGSVVTLTDHNNNILEHRSYDPFGKPRYGTMLPSSAATLFDVVGGTPFTLRGFTDHEHIDQAQLIHMNGRVYDYNLGRFLSIDPLIQAPGNSQSLNPYSYIMNNPLAGTDPSGYMSVGNLGFGEQQHCNFHCMIGYHGFTEAGSNGADVKATVEIVTLGIDKNAAEIGAPGKSDASSQQATFKLSDYLKTTADKNLSSMPEEVRHKIAAEIETAYEEHGLSGAFKEGEEAAALAYANAINPISMKYNIEIGARIFTDSEAGIAYLGNSVTNYHSSAILGEAYLDSRIIGAVAGKTKFTAYIHTHSRATPGSDGFSGLSATRTGNGSGGDLPMAAYWAKNSYVATPQGNLHKFTYSKWKDGTPMGSPEAISTLSKNVKIWENK